MKLVWRGFSLVWASKLRNFLFKKYWMLEKRYLSVGQGKERGCYSRFFLESSLLYGRELCLQDSFHTVFQVLFDGIFNISAVFDWSRFWTNIVFKKLLLRSEVLTECIFINLFLTTQSLMRFLPYAMHIQQEPYCLV